MIDAAFQVYRRAPVPFMVAMALIYVPWLAIRLIFQLNVPETPDQITANLMRVLFATGAASIVIYGLAGGAAAVLTRAVYLDEPIDVAAAFRQTLGRILPLIVGPLVAFVLIWFCSIVRACTSSARFFATATIVLRTGASLHSGGRAFCENNKLHPRCIDSRDPHDGHERRRVLINRSQQGDHQQLATALTIVVYPIIPITETLLYFDARVRNEGFDVEYLASAVTDTSPTAGPVA
jgi:hypothetical protein